MCMIALRCGRLFLNEVLSLNAQELACLQIAQAKNVLLNEVLSLNAQEYVTTCRGKTVQSSSMKS